MMVSKGKADGTVMLLIWWSLPGLLDKWNRMYGHCIQTFKAFKVQFKLCQTAGSWGKNPFIPPRLLNDDPRDHIGLLKLSPWSPMHQFSLSTLIRESMSSLLSFANALSAWWLWTCCPSVRDVGATYIGYAPLQIIRWIKRRKLLTFQRAINSFSKSP